MLRLPKYGIVLGWLFTLWFYHLAWTSHSVSAFILNGFDLAEQIALHPAIRAESPALLSSFFLWLVVPIVAGGLAFGGSLYENDYAKWFWRFVALAVALRVIPPQEALRVPTSLLDEPYTRTLTILTLLGVCFVGLSIFLSKKWLRRGQLVFIIGGMILPLIGYERAYRLLNELQLDITLGGGLWLYVICLLGLGICQIKRRQRSQPATIVTATPSTSVS